MIETMPKQLNMKQILERYNRYNQNRLERYYRLKKQRLCVTCGAAKPRSGKTQCEDCAVKVSANYFAKKPNAKPRRARKAEV